MERVSGCEYGPPKAAMLVMCARGVSAVPGAAPIMMPFNPTELSVLSILQALDHLTHHMRSKSMPSLLLLDQYRQ